METIKVIELHDRVIYVNDILQIYMKFNNYEERYNYFIQTKYSEILGSIDDYKKVKEYLLSLNDEVEIIEDTQKEDKKITKLDNNIAYYEGIYQTCWNDKEVLLVSKINEIIDKVNGE